MTRLPRQYRWLEKEPGPRILTEFIKVYGTAEVPGPQSNPSILSWARKVELEKVYRSDEIAWCGLAMAYVALQAGWDPPINPLWARNWLNFGTPVDTPMLGDVLVFSRGKVKGHVALYGGEDEADFFHVIGGNQSDAVTFKRIPRSRLLGARRCPWKINQPGNVRRVVLAACGAISTNEA